jgi:hypothetical protein
VEEAGLTRRKKQNKQKRKARDAMGETWCARGTNRVCNRNSRESGACRMCDGREIKASIIMFKSNHYGVTVQRL